MHRIKNGIVDTWRFFIEKKKINNAVNKMKSEKKNQGGEITFTTNIQDVSSSIDF